MAVAPAGELGSTPLGAVERELARVLVEALGSLLPVSLADVVVRRDFRALVPVGSVLVVVAAVALGASSAFVPLLDVAFVVLAALSSAVDAASFLLRRVDVVSLALLSLALFFLRCLVDVEFSSAAVV